MPNPTKADRPTMGALQERLAELEQENDELRRALEPFEPLRELDYMASRLGVLSLLAETLLQDIGLMTKHLAEIREGIEQAEADR